MQSTKRLRSVTQSTAHHSVSGLCYVHPHLGNVCKKMNSREIAVNLLDQGFVPVLNEISRELQLSTNALRDFFAALLKSENIDIEELASAEAIFQFDKGRWPSASVVRVITGDSKTIEYSVDAAGNTGEVL